MDTGPTTYTKATHVTYAFAGEIVSIHDPETGLYFLLDPVGSLIWDMLDGATPLSAVVEAITVEYEIDEGQAEIDLKQFIDEMNELGLLIACGLTLPDSHARKEVIPDA